jgi:CheY-like chemotaxis protein/HPt (histidine-containing phosphotransfer) domain-containing protein
MGGVIDFESRSEGGSHFWFTVQAEVIDFEGRPDTSLSMGDARILIVDDNATNRRIVCQHLSSWGCVVGMAADGHKALKELRRASNRGEAYELVLLDQKMPGMTGLELAAHIRRDSDIGGAKLVMLTSVGLALTLEDQAELQINAQLTKPVRRRELRRVLAGAVGLPVEPIQSREEDVEAVTAQTPARRDSEPRILLAEDNPVNQEVATAMLEDIGCQVTVVANGQLAVDSFSRERFDIVLMDCQMPELDGFGATTQIRSLERERNRETPGSAGSSVPIVAVTAHAMEGDRERCLETGMDDYLTKPFSRAGLVEMIEKWLDASAGDGTGAAAAPSAAAARAAAAAEASPSRHGPLDPTALDQLAAISATDGAGLVSRVIRLYLEGSASIGVLIREAAQRGDADELASNAHKLKSSSAEVGAARLSELCRRLEVKGRTNAMTGAVALADDLVAELARVRDALDERLA